MQSSYAQKITQKTTDITVLDKVFVKLLNTKEFIKRELKEKCSEEGTSEKEDCFCLFPSLDQ